MIIMREGSTRYNLFTIAALFVWILCAFPGASASLAQHTVAGATQSVVVTGALKQWHPVTLQITGPQVSESDIANPFFDYRLEATFTHSGIDYVIPGYFAADGDAAESSASAGNIWQAHFTPPETGLWEYTVSLVRGTDIAIDEEAMVAETILDNVTGTFNITASDKSGADLRGKGTLLPTDQAFLQFANGEWFIKSGTNSPENILAYSDFDGTYSLDAINFIKDYDAHIQDWQTGDPVWQGNKGKGLIGATNYLAEQSVNSAFILLNNLGLSDSEDEGNEDVWPWIAPDVYDRYDVSKLAQWDIIFSHMQQKGLALHFALQEIDNDVLLDNGDLGRTRKLFYREMFARFGYHNAVMWNIGEELRSDRNTEAQRKDYIDYIAGLDVYGHPIVAHTWPGDDEYAAIYGPLLGYPPFSGISFQIHLGSEATGDLKVYDVTKYWYEQAANSGRKWAIMMDECCGWKTGVRPWGEEFNLDDVRVDVLWGNLMAGGAGVEWFFGDRKPMQYDLATEDFRDYALIWAYTRHASAFFYTYLPFTEMAPQTGLTDDSDHLVFAKPGDTYVVYLREGGSPDLNLAAYVGNYRIKWYNPRLGGGLQNGSLTTVSGAGIKNLGTAPYAQDEDWVVLVENVGFSNYALAEFTANQDVSNPFKIQFDASSASSAGGSIQSYDWDFGDGTVASGSNPSHTYLQAGTYFPVLTITDNQGNQDIASKPVPVISEHGDVSIGLWGSYYSNINLTGTPETRQDPRINFKWGNGIPIRLVPEDSFSVRWDGFILPDFSETYTLRLEIEDGGRLWIDDVLIIDTWDVDGYSNTEAVVPMQAGKFRKIRLELVAREGRSDVRLFWKAPSLIEQIIPETHLFYGPGLTLPVELTAFTGIVDQRSVDLQWTTASELNNAGFDIERSISGSNYERIGHVPGNGTTTEASSYVYTDEEVHWESAQLYYRLRQIDFDGRFSYSQAITIEAPAPGEAVLFKNFPNPFNPSTIIRYDVPLQGHVRLKVYDVTGREVAVLVDTEVAAGRHQTLFDASNLASGVYFYRLETAQKSLVQSMLLAK